MSRYETVQELDHAVRTLMPDLPRPEQKAVAALTSGVVFGKAATLSTMSAGMPGPATNPSKLRRAQRLLANDRLDVSAAQRHLIARLLAGQRGRMELLLDATPTAVTAHCAGIETLCLSIAWHGRTLPLLWQSRNRGVGAHPSWGTVTDDFFAQVAPLLSTASDVVVMADRGLVGRPLLDRILTQGWHYILRCERTALIRTADASTCTLAELVPTSGAPTCCLTGVQIFAPRAKVARNQRHTEGRGTWYRVWQRAITTNVVAVWRTGDPDPWLLLTDLPATPARCTDYRRRTWEEDGFRDWKSSGWNWQKSRVRLPERVDRLILLLALATVWMAVLAQRVIRRGERKLLEPRSRRCYSYFQLGLRYIERLLALDQPIPVSLHMLPESRASVKLS
jgi:hypothetical protein